MGNFKKLNLRKPRRGTSPLNITLGIIAVILLSSIAFYFIGNQNSIPQQSLAYISVNSTNSSPKVGPSIIACASCSKNLEFSFTVTSTLIKESTVSLDSVIVTQNLQQVGSTYQKSDFTVTYNNSVQTKPTKIYLNEPAIFTVNLNTQSNNWLPGTYALSFDLVFGSPFIANYTYSLSAETFSLLNGIPTNIKSFVPISITNSQNVNTTAPYQQMLTINSAKYASYETANLSNVEFFDYGGNLLNSWLENGNNKWGTSIYWISLPNGIPASSTIIIYMGFANTTTNLFDGVHVGEASQLSPVFGQYNNIGNVMNAGLMYQVYYSKNATVVDLLHDQKYVYQAYMNNGSRLGFNHGDFNTTIDPMVTPLNGNYGANVYTILGYQYGLSGLPAWPSNAVPNPTHSFAVKVVGWADSNTTTTYTVSRDDGMGVSMSDNGPAFNGSTWLGGSNPPNNGRAAWFEQGNTAYYFNHQSGGYRIEVDYYEGWGASFFQLYTNKLINYFHAALPPNNVVPTYTSGTFSVVTS